MKTVRKCRATLKTGKPCRYGAKPPSEFCGTHGHHAHATAKTKNREASPKEPAGRDAELALIVSTALALIEIIEKVATYFPALLKFLEQFHAPTCYRWRFQGTLQGLKAVAQYKEVGTTDGLWEFRSADEIGKNNAPTAADPEYAALIMSIHYIALTHWASSTALSSLHKGGIRSYGRMGEIHQHREQLDSEPVKLSSGELEALRQIYNTCRTIPFVDDLFSSNFSEMWRGVDLLKESNRT